MPAADGAFRDYSGRALVLNSDGSRKFGDHRVYMPRTRQAIGFQHYDTGVRDTTEVGMVDDLLMRWAVGMSCTRIPCLARSFAAFDVYTRDSLREEMGGASVL